MKPEQEKLLSDLYDANNLLWKSASYLLKSSWEGSSEQKRAVLSRLAKISDSVTLSELLLKEAFLFLEEKDPDLFLKETASTRIEELMKSVQW